MSAIPAVEVILGDADEDGRVTILDSTEIQRWLAGDSTHENIGKHNRQQQGGQTPSLCSIHRMFTTN